MSWQALVQALVLVGLLAATVPFLGRYMADVYGARDGRLGARRPVLRPDRAGDLPDLRHRRQARAALERLRHSLAGVQPRVGARCCTRSSGCRACCRSTRPTGPGVSPMGSFNSAISFVTNTNWQWYSGEVSISHLTNMFGNTVQNFVSAAAGHGGRDRADPGHHPHRHPQPRQLLGRSRPHAAAHPAPAEPRVRGRPDLAGRGPEPQRLHRRRHDRSDPVDAADPSTAITEQLDPRRSAWRRRRRSRSSARTAVASSTPTRRTRSPTRTA